MCPGSFKILGVELRFESDLPRGCVVRFDVRLIEFLS